MKTNLFSKVFMAIAMILTVLVVSFSFTSCGDEWDELEKPVNPTPEPTPDPVDPEWYVYDVFQVDCKATNIDWKSSKNVTLTKSTRAFSDEEQEGYAQASVSHSYTADIEYRDKNDENEQKHEQKSQSYTTDLFTRLYGLSKNMVFASVDEMSQAAGTLEFAQNTTNGKLYTLSFGGSRQVVLKATANTSVESLSFEGKTVSDLCSADWSDPEYVGKETTKVTSDQTGYDKYQMTVRVRVTVANSGLQDISRIMSFVIANVYVKKVGENPDPLPTPDPEVTGYDVINNNFSNNKTTGTIVVIYDDLSQEEVGDFAVTLNHRAEAPEDRKLNVTSLDWTLGQTTENELAATGESRYVDVAANCRVNINEVYTSMTNRTNRAAMTFKGFYEIPTIQFPDGTSKKLAHGEYAMSDKSVEETASSETSKTLTHKVDASFNGGSVENLKANVTLNKVNDTPDPSENEETGIAVENLAPQGNVYTMDVIHYWSNSDPTTESISIAHQATQSAEEEMLTESRNYNTTTPSMVEVNSNDSYRKTAGTMTVTGLVKTYESKFVFAGADVTVTSTYLASFTLTSEAGNTATVNVKASAYKKGSSQGTQDLGDESKSVFKDKVNFALLVQNTDIASCTQILRYEEKKETPVDPDPEDPTEDIFAKVISNSIEFVNGYWTATMKASIKNSKGVERDTTMQVIYTSAGASFGSIADFISKDNSFDFTRFNNGSSSTSNAESGKAVVTYTKQNMTAVYDKFNHDITVTNGAAYIMLAGQKLEFLPTEIAVEDPTTDQVSAPVVSGEYNVWASSVSYRYGFNSHYDNSKTDFNIKVEKPVEPIIIDADRIIGGAITVTVDADTNPMLSLVIACGNKTIIYNDSYRFKSGKTSVDVSKSPLIKPAMEFANIPSATLNGTGSDRNPANLVIGNGEWAYYADGYTRLFGAQDVLTTGCTDPVIAVGTIENGMLKIKNGDSYIYFSVR
jgi:lipoprotein